MNDHQPQLIKENPETVENYEFEPIKGYPMLHWKGKRSFRSTHFYPAQLKENHGEPALGWMNQIYWGDNLQVMSHLLKKYRGQVKLIYIDPPFDSKADYKKKITLQGQTVESDHMAFEEKQYSDIWTNDEYLQFMYERLILLRELLSDDGSILLHCDSRKAHQLRCILDEIFGAQNFRNELIIKRPITKNLQAQFDTINSFSLGHDNLYLYSKNPNTKYMQAYDKYETTKSEGYWHRFWSGENRPNLRYEILGISIETGQWKWKKERAFKAHDNYQNYLKELGNRNKTEDQYKLVDYWHDTGESLEFLRLSNTETIENWYPPSDKKLANTLWLDYKTYENQKEYPTQKHEELLSIIIERFSYVGDIVFDCFMGSGTTQAVAMKLGRRFIGADINLGAIQTTTKRLLNISKELNQKEKSLITDETEISTYYTGFSVYNVNHYDVFRNPVQAKELLIEALEIQPLPSSSVYDGEKDGRLVKIMPVNRIATRADLNELITNFDYKTFEKRAGEHPGKPVENILIVCMGHEIELAAHLKKEVPFELNVEIVDILRDRSDLQFKRDSEAEIKIEKGHLVIKKFYPLNLLNKLSLEKEKVKDWPELVESVMIDWNYDGSVLEPGLVDVPEKNELVKGKYKIPEGAGTIRVKITDLISESVEVTVE